MIAELRKCQATGLTVSFITEQEGPMDHKGHEVAQKVFGFLLRTTVLCG
jgi:hypothetical protein